MVRGAVAVQTTLSGTSSVFGWRPAWLNDAGDFAIRQRVDNGVMVATVRGDTGHPQGKPASIGGVACGTHAFDLDAGMANANSIDAIIGTQCSSMRVA